MTDNPEEWVEEDGMRWVGSRAELDAWKAYKQRKALAFVERGYSIAWYADADGWIDVYEPQRDHANMPEIRASVKFYGKPSEYGIDGGMVSKLMITETWRDPLAHLLDGPSERVNVVFNYDRGPDVNRLESHPRARRLYDAVLDELN